MTLNAIDALFPQRDVIDYVNQRPMTPMLGETLFPSRKVQSFSFDYLLAGSRTPVVASVHAFDTESEMGSREAQSQAMSLALVKRKMQLKETDLLALRQPRNASEQAYLVREVYNDVEKVVSAIEARAEVMRMEALANGTVTIKENGLDTKVDYLVPTTNKVTGTFNSATSILDLLQDWTDIADDTPTRILTSKKIRNAMLTHPEIKSLFKDMAVLPSFGNLNILLSQMGLPTIAVYDAKYRKQKADGTYEKLRYFPEDKMVLMSDVIPGETIWGMTPEEARIVPGGDKNVSVGNIFAHIYEENLDPVATFTKASAIVMPSLPEANNIVQAQITLA